LWHNAQGVQFINADSKSECRSFSGENEKNILLVGNTDWYNKNKLNNVDKVIFGVLKNNKYIEKERIDKIINEFHKRVNNLDILLGRKQESPKIENSGYKR